MSQRRDALKALAALTLAPSLAACATGALRSNDAAGPTVVGERLRAFVLMRGALDDRIVIGNLVGQYHGVVGTVVEPLFGLVAATFSRYRALPDGRYAIVSFEQAYYTTLDGARVIDELVNPYTGVAVRVPVWTGEPVVQFVDADLRMRPVRPVPPPARVAQAATAVAAGPDEAVFVERLAVEGGGGYNEIVTLRAPAAAVRARGARQVGCRTSYTSVLAWRAWLGMGERPGHLMAHGAGGYGLAASELPTLFVEETRRRRPLALADPARILAPALRDLDVLSST